MENTTLTISAMPQWGFGNRLLYYHNLRQSAFHRNMDWSCCSWNGTEHFEGAVRGAPYPPPAKEEFLPCLGERFFTHTALSTREIFKLNSPPPLKGITAAVHFRGRDFASWHPKAILPPSYYLSALEELRDINTFYLFTDDLTLPSFEATKKLLTAQGKNIIMGDNTSDRSKYINDFSIMTECDYLISSPSTFAISAGFIGKYKKIIHSKEWIEYCLEIRAKFWEDLYTGGNEDYKLWKLI